MTKVSDPLLLIRADASVAIGTGHVMRGLALAQAWQDAGGSVTFAMADSTPAIQDRLRSEGVGFAHIDAARASDSDCQQLLVLARPHPASWLVLDGYEFGPKYQRALKNERIKFLLIDDNGCSGACSANIVLNQNMHARESLYRLREAGTRLLLGTKYALLRREFVSVHEPREISPRGHKLLVSMGGSDPENVTRRVMEALDQVDVAGLEVLVVAGGSNPHLASIIESVAKSRHRCRILNNVSNMRELISWADFAISAAGTACWEYCALGLPAVLLAVADNQIPNAEALHSARAAILIAGGSRFATGEMAQLIAHLVSAVSERQLLSRNALTLVDGGGAARTVSAMMG